MKNVCITVGLLAGMMAFMFAAAWLGYQVPPADADVWWAFPVGATAVLCGLLSMVCLMILIAFALYFTGL